MKTLIKFTLVVLVLTFMFIKVYVPLMSEANEERTMELTKQKSSLNKCMSSKKIGNGTHSFSDKRNK
jgi:hypothetical protein